MTFVEQLLLRNAGAALVAPVLQSTRPFGRSRARFGDHAAERPFQDSRRRPPSAHGLQQDQAAAVDTQTRVGRSCLGLDEPYQIAVRKQRRVGRQRDQGFRHGLGHKQPVERVAMMQG